MRTHTPHTREQGLQDGASVQHTDWCPVHGRSHPSKCEYEFGKRKDVVLTTYEGCQCACVRVLAGFNDPAQYYTTYAAAQGRARMAHEFTNTLHW